MNPLDAFHPAVAAWFTRAFDAPTRAQALAWPAIQAGRHVLVAAPTGSGKTLAAFLAAIDQLVRDGLNGLPDETRVLYVSPLKALSNDVRRNLEAPLEGIGAELAALGLPAVDIRSVVRTGDTSASERAAMRRLAPHIVVTTPESLYILLTSESGRRMLATTRTVIVDEIHAVAGGKRGSHLMLSLERLQTLATRPLTRIGLSATQKPLDEMARFLVGGADARDCTIIDQGHVRNLDLALELPPVPLEAVMSGETWTLVYDRLAELIAAHRTTLVFVNTRRLVERVARHVSERVGEEHVGAHHGSLSKERRLEAEQRLKRGELKVLVATASLELGIDIGDVDLVCQIGSTRSIGAFLQRVGRAGHAVGGTSKGRLFPLSRDELVECAAMLAAVRRGELDRLVIPQNALDVLAQQIVAEVAARDWPTDELYEVLRRAHPYRNLTLQHFDECIDMLAEGFSTRRGRHGALLHHDGINRMLRARKSSRLTAITSGGAIPDNADYRVIMEPAALLVGTVNEDFAVESLQGDVFQLGNASYRILRVERGTVRVEDAHGQPPSIPFWLGEAPGRSAEMSAAVSALKAGLERRLTDDDAGDAETAEGQTLDARAAAAAGAAVLPSDTPAPTLLVGAMRGVATEVASSDAKRVDDKSTHAGSSTAATLARARRWLMATAGLDDAAAGQLVDYLAAGRAALGALPTLDTVIFERFFDESGGMQLIIHSSFGSRVNRAWGLALRKRFCRTFNFELQAAATEDHIVLSLTHAHSFELAEVARYLHSNSVRHILVQALCAAPMFEVRWRWVAGISLALPRFRGGKKIPPQIARMNAEDLLASIFPDQVACAENLPGEIEIPDHPLVRQTIRDCLEEAMEAQAFETVLRRLESGDIRIIARDLTEPSPLALEALTARPYAYLDDAPLEERRTQAVMSRRWMDPESAADIGRLDPEAIARVKEEAWPDATSADELHDALSWLTFMTVDEVGRNPAWAGWLAALAGQGRVARVELACVDSNRPDAIRRGAVEAEHPPIDPDWVAARDVNPSSITSSSITVERFPPDGLQSNGLRTLWVAAERRALFEPVVPASDEALVEIVRGRLEGLGPVTVQAIAESLALPAARIESSLAALQAEGFAMRGSFSPGAAAPEWCDRRLLARIHRYTVKRLRAEIEPVPARDFLRFLFDWQRVLPEARMQGADAVAAILAQLEGFEAAAAAWETDILPARIAEYEPAWLDEQGRAGRFVWTRLASRHADPERGAAPVRSTPITLLARRNVKVWSLLTEASDPAHLTSRAADVARYIEEQGASFFDDIAEGLRLLPAEVEEALAELVALGLVNSDSFGGLRALLVPGARRGAGAVGRRRRRALFQMADAGRWALVRRPAPVAAPRDEAVETIVRSLLRRWGVIFWKLLAREADWLPPWREILMCCRRLEARGEIRGGRFVAGFSGEQFATPEAVGSLRDQRRKPPAQQFVSLSAADPLNLIGILTPGPRLASLTGNRLLYLDGMPVAVYAADEVQFLDTPGEPPLDVGAQWEARNVLLRRHVPLGLADLA